MLKRRMFSFLAALFFTFLNLFGGVWVLSSLIPTASALTVNNNEILTNFIVTTPRPYLTAYYQSGSQVVPWTIGYSSTISRYQYTSGTGRYNWFTASSPNYSTEQYQWINATNTSASSHIPGPFPSLGYATTSSATTPSILVLPRVSDTPSPSSPASTIYPFSFVFTIPQPTTEYHGLSISFSDLNFGMTVSAPDGNPSFNQVVSDCYASIVINGKTWSTVRFTSSSSDSINLSTGLTDIVTLDVWNTDNVSIVFSVYPPTVFQSTQTTSFRLTNSFYGNGQYQRVTFPLNTASTLTYPLQYCWYNTSTTPDFDDGFENGVPGDYEPGNGSGSGGGDNSAQLQEIQDSLDKLGTSLDEYQGQVEQMAEEINTGLDKVDQSIKDSTDTIMGDDSDPDNPTGIKGLISMIKNLPTSIFEGLVHLFVPTEEDIDEIRQAYEDMFSSRLGFVSQVGEAIGSVFDGIHDLMVANLADDEYTFHFPGISFPMNGQTYVIAAEQEVSLNNKFFFTVRPFAGTIVIIISILAVINTAQRLFEALFITETGKYFWSGGSD